MTTSYKLLSFAIIYFHLIIFFNGFIFSVIMAIYNTGRYLDDSIGSILNQTINFESIQIILVNDGSIDQTEETCLIYKNKQPKNIIYIKIEHSGVSKARNVGINYSNGTYISFLDPDDKWDYKAFKYMLTFLENNKDINFVAGRIKFFEANNHFHPLDYKFNRTRIINLTNEYNCIQLSASSCIFRKTLFDNNNFDEKVSLSEDSLFLNKILLLKPLYGLIKEAIYYYRRRFDSSSVIQNTKYNIHFYYEHIPLVIFKLINISKSIYNKIIPFIQFIIAYEILFKIKMELNNYLDSVSYQTYNIKIKESLKLIEDKYILEQNYFSYKDKFVVLFIKHNKDLRYNIKFENNCLMYKKNIIIDLNKDNNIFLWNIIEINNNVLHLEGKDNFWMPKDTYFIFCQLGNISNDNNHFFPKYIDYPNYDIITMYGTIEKGRIFVFNIPINDRKIPLTLYFYISYLNFTLEIYTSFTWFCHISNFFNGYLISDNYIIKNENKRLIILKKNKVNLLESEYLFCEEIKKKTKNYIIKLRKHINNKKNIQNKSQIWIINDIKDRARDNGEYFFRYLNIKQYEGIKFYFAIQKNCSDFKRLQKIGNILDLNSFRYFYIILEVNKIISSTTDNYAYNTFEGDYKFIKDLFYFDFIYLQNEFIKDDLSRQINRYNKNFNMLLASSFMEYKAILNPKYGYNKNNLITAIFPRYEYLKIIKNNLKTEKRIIIYPTYRKTIKESINPITHTSIYYNSFTFTEYYNFYNNLMNDKRLRLIMNQYNYTGLFCINSYFSSQLNDFNENEKFTIHNNCDDNKNIIFNSSILVTDYLNLFFDFGYLKKPVIYTQFDYNEYIIKDTPKGFYNYYNDGFGPICNDIQCTVDEIIYEIKTNCKLRKKYLRRIKKFFKFSNNDNNERIYNGIIKINKSNKNIKYLFNLSFFLLFIKLFYYIKKQNKLGN